MAAALTGNIMVSNIRTNISATTATGVTSGANQVLASNILANPTLGSGNYTYQWSQSGTTITFTAATSNSTNCTYGSLSVAGSTTIFCTVTDTWTGVKSVTSNCVLTWPIQTIPITAVTWSIGGATNSVYTGSPQSVTVVSVSPPGATYNTSMAMATNAGSVVSTTVTGSGTYTGTFTSPNLTITQKQLTGPTSCAITACGGFSTQTMESSGCAGLIGADTGTLTAYNGGPSGPISICPVSTNDSSTINAVAQGSTNPKTGLSNGTNSMIMCSPGYDASFPDHYYWFVFGGNSNYISSTGIGNNASCST